MLTIPEDDRNLIELFIFLPMAVTVLEQDIETIKKGPFKLKKPYFILLEKTIKIIKHDLRDIKSQLQKKNIKIHKQGRDDIFTQFVFFYNGYEEKHNYFNPRIRNSVEDLMEKYLLKANTFDNYKEAN